MSKPMGRVPASRYPGAEYARWVCFGLRGTVSMADLMEIAARQQRTLIAYRYMHDDDLWNPTGDCVRVYPDGTVERIGTGGE